MPGLDGILDASAPVEFSGIKGKFFAWFLTSPFRAILHKKMGNPDPRFMELLALTGSETVVDFGSGSGHHSLMVAQKLTTGKVIASDVSKAMLDKLGTLATKRGVADRIEILQEDALNLSSVPSESADCAISLATSAWRPINRDTQGASESACLTCHRRTGT